MKQMKGKEEQILNKQSAYKQLVKAASIEGLQVEDFCKGLPIDLPAEIYEDESLIMKELQFTPR